MPSRLRELSGISTSKPPMVAQKSEYPRFNAHKHYSIHTRKSGSKAFFRKFQEVICLGRRQIKSTKGLDADWEHWMKHVRVMPIPCHWRGADGNSVRTFTAYQTSGWKESDSESYLGLQNVRAVATTARKCATLTKSPASTLFFWVLNWCSSGCLNSDTSISAKQKKNNLSHLSQPKTSKIQLGNHEAHGLVWLSNGTEDRRTLFQALANMPATEATTCPGEHKFRGVNWQDAKVEG